MLDRVKHFWLKNLFSTVNFDEGKLYVYQSTFLRSKPKDYV